MRIALCQIAPVFLSRAATLQKAVDALEQAAEQQAQLAVFGEVFAPGYPIWLSRTGGASFDSAEQKAWHARYLREAVDLEAGDLAVVEEAAKRLNVAVVIGVAERPISRGGQTIYCSAVTIGPDGRRLSVHRKLMPTYEERLAWGTGDGHGLVVHDLHDFRMGTLNCWENWMPLARHALQGQGENLHIAIWPGTVANTYDITRFMAREGRSYVVSVCAPLRTRDLPEDLPNREALVGRESEWIHDGGSCVAQPNGEWLIQPIAESEGVTIAEIELERVREERQNFDPAGHYARPDVLQLSLNRERQQSLAAGEHRPG